MARDVTYGYYTGTYGGTAIEEADWAHLSQLASGHIGRICALAIVTPYGERDRCESMAVCAVAEVLQTWEDATTNGAGVTSERVGSVSESYASAEQLMPQGLDAAIAKAMRPWLHVCLVVR